MEWVEGTFSVPSDSIDKEQEGDKTLPVSQLCLSKHFCPFFSFSLSCINRQKGGKRKCVLEQEVV